MKAIRATLLAAVLILPMAGGAQEHQAGMTHAAQVPVTEPGQGAFAAIAEIVTRLRSDTATDWTRVDIEALCRHLIDMDNVTLGSAASIAEVPGGTVFSVIANDPDVVASIQSMVTAHAATMNDPSGWRLGAVTTATGADLTVTGEAQQIRALGFIGVMTVGLHHQAHHWAIATGTGPHD